MRKTIEAYGRTIVLEVAEELDHFGQFKVRLTIDGREKYWANYNNHGEMPEREETG